MTIRLTAAECRELCKAWVEKHYGSTVACEFWEEYSDGSGRGLVETISYFEATLRHPVVSFDEDTDPITVPR